MDISYLREFLTLASHLKLTTAARELYMSPSTLSQHITSLEKELGTELFTRGSRLALTPRGEESLEHVQNILFEYDALKSCCSGDSGTILRLSVPNYHYLKEPVISARQTFLQTHPDYHVILDSNECQNEDPFEILDDGSSDISALFIVRGCSYTVDDKVPEEVSYIELHPQRCVFVSSQNHPLANKKVLSSQELDGAIVNLKLCPVCSIIADGLTRVLSSYGANIKVQFRSARRNEDILEGGLGDRFMLWFETFDGKGCPPPNFPDHRFEHDLIADSYLLYRKDRLSDAQLSFLDVIGRDLLQQQAPAEQCAQ